VGIGVVFGAPESTAADAPRPVFLTQNFYAKAGADTPARPSTALRDRVDEQRKSGGQPAVAWVGAMNKIAQRRADGAAGIGPGINDDDLQAQVFALGLKSLQQHQVSAGSFADLLSLELWIQLAAAAKVGVGVAQAGTGQGLVMVILVGQ
jgi:hypothetical protein